MDTRAPGRSRVAEANAPLVAVPRVRLDIGRLAMQSTDPATNAGGHALASSGRTPGADGTGQPPQPSADTVRSPAADTPDASNQLGFAGAEAARPAASGPAAGPPVAAGAGSSENASGSTHSDRELARATATASTYSSIFSGLAGVAAELARSAASSRTAFASVTARPSRGSSELADWTMHLERLAVATTELQRSCATAHAAVVAARVRPEVLSALPLLPEVSRIGQAARLVAADLALVDAARELVRAAPPSDRHARAFEERLLRHASAFDALLTLWSAGGQHASPVQANGVIDAAAADLHFYFDPTQDSAGSLAATGASGLLHCATVLSTALEAAVRELTDSATMSRAASGSTLDAAAPPPPAERNVGNAEAGRLDQLLERAAQAASRATPLAGATPASDSGQVTGNLAPPVRSARSRRHLAARSQANADRTRPPEWEHVVPESVHRLGVEDVAAALGAERPGDVRQLLVDGLQTRHRFVIWHHRSVVFSSELVALISQGLLETRTLAQP